MKKLAIIGSGDLGQLIAHHAVTDKQFEVYGFFDDTKDADTVVQGHSIRGSIKDIQLHFDEQLFDYVLIGIGYKHFDFRKKLFIDLQGKIPFANLIHSSCYIDPSVKIGVGNVLLPGCVLDMNAELKDNILLNTACTIAHDSSIGSHTFLSPAVSLAGFIQIGACCNLGINTTVIDNIDIANEVQTGGGTVVINDLNQKGLYVGNPARFVR